MRVGERPSTGAGEGFEGVLVDFVKVGRAFAVPELAHVIAARRAVLAGKFRPSECSTSLAICIALAFYHALRGVPGIFAHEGARTRASLICSTRWSFSAAPSITTVQYLRSTLPTPTTLRAMSTPRYCSMSLRLSSGEAFAIVGKK